MERIYPNPKREHLQQVDYIRAIASLGVALFHLGGKSLPLLNHGWLGVEMFFLLSGFIICWSIPLTYQVIKDAKTFLLKRLIRIEPPYLISIALVLLLNNLLIKSYEVNWENVFLHFAYVNNFTGQEYLNPIYWTLGIEFQFYIFIALLFPILKFLWGQLILLGFCVLPVLFSISHELLLALFPIFGMGIYATLFKKKLIDLKWLLIFLTISTICGILSIGWKETLAAVIALIIIFSDLKSNRVIAFFAKISFSLYLIHDIIGSRVVVLLGRALPDTIFHKAITFGTGILVSILFSYLFYILVEKVFLKLSKAVQYKSFTNLQSSLRHSDKNRNQQ